MCFPKSLTTIFMTICYRQYQAKYHLFKRKIFIIVDCWNAELEFYTGCTVLAVGWRFKKYINYEGEIIYFYCHRNVGFALLHRPSSCFLWERSFRIPRWIWSPCVWSGRTFGPSRLTAAKKIFKDRHHHKGYNQEWGVYRSLIFFPARSETLIFFPI